MNYARLKACPWVLMSEADAEAWLAPARSAPSFGGGFRQSASAQIIYLRSGTLEQAKYLRGELKKLARAFPTVRDIRGLRKDVATFAPLYTPHFEGDRWYLRNESKSAFEPPFAGCDFRLFFETSNPGTGFRLPRDRVLDALSAMPLLDGRRTLKQIVDEAFDVPVARALINYFAEAGILELAAATHVETTSLPEFVFLGHSSFAVRDESDLLVVDPVVLPPNQLLGEPHRSLFALLSNATAVLISHHHWDHLHLQTLTRLPRNKPFIVPRNRHPSFSNPPIATYLRSLGFTDVREHEPGDEVSIGKIRVRLFPFFGESFGLRSHFDAFTYHIEFSGKSLYGSVDAWCDDAGDMEATIADVAAMGPVDFFLFGASGQRHDPPHGAAAPRYFSNELEARPDLVRYHPEVVDVERWCRVLRPRYLVPYAEFLFHGAPLPDLRLIDLPEKAPATVADAMRILTRDDHLQWASALHEVSKRTHTPLVMFQPMQGLAFQ